MTIAPPRRRAESPAGLRARRVEVARRAGRRRLRVLVALLAVLSLALGALSLVHSSVFAVRGVTVVGARETSTAEVVTASGLGNHPPLVDVDTAAVASAVERLPWVLAAHVAKQWPSSVRITLSERVPVAYSATAAGDALIDATGRVLEDLPRSDARLTAELAPLGALPTPAPGATLPLADSPLCEVAAALPVALVGRLRVLELGSGVGVTAELASGATVVFGSAAELKEKMIALSTLVVRPEVTAGARLDLRVPSAPVLTR